MRAAVDWAGTRREHDEGDGLEARREGRLAQMRRSKCRAHDSFTLNSFSPRGPRGERAGGGERSLRALSTCRAARGTRYGR